MNNYKKIGVIAGVFDPIHLGHIEFINQTIQENNLDKALILIEKTPKHKLVFTDYSDRNKMVKLAIANEPIIEIYEHTFENWPLSNCLPEIKTINPESQIYLLVGKDVAEHITSWRGSEDLLREIEIVIAKRNDGITSGQIRGAIASGQQPKGLNTKVEDYIISNKLY